MSIMATAAYEEEIGGQARRLILRNREIDRFEVQHQIGIFEIWDQMFSRGRRPQARHVRDLVALALVGGGMSDRHADELVADLPPSENFRLLETARRVLGVTFIPQVISADKKKAAGSPPPRQSASPDTERPSGSETSAV